MTENNPNPMPPQYAGAPRQESFGNHIIKAAFICALLIVGLAWVNQFVGARESNRERVSAEVTQNWGAPQQLSLPYFYVYTGDEYSVSTPSMADVDVKINGRRIERGIYPAQIYDATVKMTGRLHVDTGADSVKVSINLPPTTIVKRIKINGKMVEVPYVKDECCYEATLDGSDFADGNVQFEFETNVRGSQSFSMTLNASEADVNVSGEGDDVSFTDAVPDSREIDGRKFRAHWGGLPLDSNIRVSLLPGVDLFRQVDRSVKYGFLVVVLTFACMAFVEMLTRRRFNIQVYFLTGAALVVLYLLLLSFAEIIGFGAAYLIATLMTTALITVYVWRYMASRGIAATVCSLLIVCYLCSYIMLSLNEYALLMGSLLLFVVIMVMMYGSIKIRNNNNNNAR